MDCHNRFAAIVVTLEEAVTSTEGLWTHVEGLDDEAEGTSEEAVAHMLASAYLYCEIWLGG